MRIPNLLSAVCAAVVCAGVTAVRAQETPAQAAALAALKQKMNELDAQSGQPTNSPLTPVVVPPSGAKPEQPAPPVAPPIATPVAPPPVAAPVPPTVAPPIAPRMSPPVVLPRAPTRAVVSDNSDFFTPVPPASHPGLPAPAQATTPGSTPEMTPAQPKPSQTATNPAAAQAPAKSTAKASPSKPKVAKPPTTKPAVTPAPAKKAAKAKSKSKPVAGETVYPGKALGFSPIAPPPPPVTAQQEAELHALLNRYMANEITPDQYQVERKKIMDGQ